LYQIVWVSVLDCVGECARLCGRVCQILWVSVPDCVGECTRLCGWVYQIVWVSVPDCVGECTRLCGWVCQILLRQSRQNCCNTYTTETVQITYRNKLYNVPCVNTMFSILAFLRHVKWAGDYEHEIDSRRVEWRLLDCRVYVLWKIRQLWIWRYTAHFRIFNILTNKRT